MFVAALFTTAKIWNQTRCLPMDKWIKKMAYTYNQIIVIHKSDATQPFAARWMELEDLMLSEISQTWKDEHQTFSTVMIWVLCDPLPKICWSCGPQLMALTTRRHLEF
jgi:hypothetical protein